MRNVFFPNNHIQPWEVVPRSSCISRFHLRLFIYKPLGYRSWLNNTSTKTVMAGTVLKLLYRQVQSSLADHTMHTPGAITIRFNILEEENLPTAAHFNYIVVLNQLFMGKGRLEAFSDGVIAIIITIMVLEMKVPHGDTFASLKPLIPVFISYMLSFVNVGIYWNNHHHMLHAAQRVNGKVLWNNIHLLFWLSLVPFVTGWMGENHFTARPVALYGTVLLMNGVAYTFLALALSRLHGPHSAIALAIGRDKKGKLSILIYAIGIGLSFINNWMGFACYVIVACMWFIPDKRIENELIEKKNMEIEKAK
jgi:uncharacterized membrane protein